MSDFEDVVESLRETDEKDLSRLGKLATSFASLLQMKQNLEAQLKVVDQDIKRVQENDIPSLMAELGMKKFVLEDGSQVSVAPYYSASISKERQDEAFFWLNENGFGDLIKNTVTARFGRGEDDIAEKVVTQLANQGYVAEAQKKVEPMTLKAWVKEQFEKGVNIPQELFGVYAGQKATIKKG